MKILAAIVTFNRCELLARCVDHVCSQLRPPDAIIVINNGSTDSTLDMLAAKGIEYITQENVGSAGGWYRAIKQAFDGGFDAVWLMDDDGFPATGALACLEQALEPGVACASSIVVQEDRPDHFVFSFPILDKTRLPVIFRNPRKVATVDDLLALSPSGTYPFTHLFNGALVSVLAAEQAGNVNRDFFIYGDEVDYFFRLRNVGKVFSVLAAQHFHPDVSQRPYSPIKVYYYIKNTLILNKRYFNLVSIRNGLTVVVALVRIAQRNGLSDALSYVFGSRASFFYRAIIRGLQGRIGKDFDAKL